MRKRGYPERTESSTLNWRMAAIVVNAEGIARIPMPVVMLRTWRLRFSTGGFSFTGATVYLRLHI